MIDEGGAPPSTWLPMLTRSQERLLRFLGGFPESLEQAWDVPRDVSLPGLAEAMGVVRSGLNQPLAGLLDDGYISVRIAHVLGGGSRRRQVYHITNKGRGWLDAHPEEHQAKEGGESPESLVLVGRADELHDLDRLLRSEKKAILGGLSGVGKTALLRTFVAGHPSGTVKWADADEFSDAHTIVSAWFPKDASVGQDVESMVERAVEEGKSTLFVVDDVHRLSTRHLSSVVTLLNGVAQAGRHVVLAGRLPLPEGLDWPVMRVATLDPKSAQSLLGEHLDEDTRLEVAQALGGHPMALHLYREGDPLPEAGEDIQAFVEHTMLSTLSDEEHEALDQMILFPRPLPADVAPGGEMVGSLDDRALLRWTADAGAFEVQHLVRNVRRTMLSETEQRALHERALKHWQSFEDRPQYAILRFYHAMALEQKDIDAMMDTDFDALLANDGAALAVVFDRATQQRPEDESLHYWAGRVALQRHELDVARHHIEHVNTEEKSDDLRHQLALLEGDEAEAQRLLERQLERATSVEKVRLLLRTAVQHLDDRLFDEHETLDEGTVQSLLNGIELPEALDARSSIMVSMSLIQHALALHAEDFERANSLIDQLVAVSHEHDPLVLQLRLKTAFRNASPDTDGHLKDEVERTLGAQTTPFHRAVVGLMHVEHLVLASDDTAGEVFTSLPSPEEMQARGVAGLRYAARWWYLRGHINPQRAPMALREASRLFRQAGCLNASKAAAKRLHRVL